VAAPGGNSRRRKGETDVSLLNKKACREYLLDEAKRTGKGRLERVGEPSYRWLEEELTKRMDWLVSVHPFSGPKTILPPK